MLTLSAPIHKCPYQGLTESRTTETKVSLCDLPDRLWEPNSLGSDYMLARLLSEERLYEAAGKGTSSHT